MCFTLDLSCLGKQFVLNVVQYITHLHVGLGSVWGDEARVLWSLFGSAHQYKGKRVKLHRFCLR